ncbi:HDL461Wp [Eremothecium sinecaudum]|uniref:HDL461Wp n=1 Tax=Eremothecium sinecaudum TaxID=45286 RepID=A0A120K232_9SACH|nr:HDL461Wp [Eremothecium sinecaudum]AMD20283.1 HDL461Wp [Eremothecium sinecaudum]
MLEADVPSDLRLQLSLWLEYDKNEETRAEIVKLIADKAWDELRRRVHKRIGFGTAGLRAKMAAGFCYMNTLTVLQASQGLASYIKTQFPDNLKVVVGHDHRFHSREFAEITIAAFLQLQFEVYYLNFVPNGADTDSFVHTPLVPFTIENIEGGAACGIMITASHNPKMDNGYKVYYANGCQIIPPHDLNISNAIEANLKPWDRAWETKQLLEEAWKNGRLHDVQAEMVEKYSNKIKDNLIRISHIPSASTPFFVYTPMHGVGNKIFKQLTGELLQLEENKDYVVVAEQRDPDPNFPTVSFPNPEEKGALDMGIRLADTIGVSLVIANDPDADRFSVAVRKGNDWTQLTGNQIGFLFAYAEMVQYSKSHKDRPLAMLSSTVSSQMLAKMAEVDGFTFKETLTGFKWLGNCAKELKQQGYYVPFAFEEAIGYMFGSVAFDKDGITAAIVFLQMYLDWKLKGLSPLDVLDEGYEKYGNFAEYNGYYIMPDSTAGKKVFDYIRNDMIPDGYSYPQKLGDGFKVTNFRDLTVGYQSNTPGNVPDLPVDSSSQMISCSISPSSQDHTSDTVRFTIRSSGTEPKLKVYIESCSSNHENATRLAKQTWEALKREWIRPEVTGLTTNL